MTPSLEGWTTKAKEAPFPHEVRLAPPNTNPVFQSLRGKSSEEQQRDDDAGRLKKYSICNALSIEEAK